MRQFPMARHTTKWHLSAAEDVIMNILWNSETPMIKAEIVEEANEKDVMCWQERSCFTILNHLLSKNLIQAVDLKKSGKALARAFAPTMSRPEYYANVVYDCVPAAEQREFRKFLRAKLTDELA